MLLILVPQLGVDLGKVNLTNWHFVGWILKIVLKQMEITFVDLIDKVHRQIVEVVFYRMRALWPMAFAFVKARDLVDVDFLGRFDFVQDALHPVIELLSPKDVVVPAAIHDECRNMTRHC